MEELSRDKDHELGSESDLNISGEEEFVPTELGKEELIKLYYDLVERNEFGKTEEKLSEVKSALEALLDAERAEALKKFTEEGNAPEDFSYKEDKLAGDIRKLFAQYKIRKKQHFREKKREEEVNLRNKREILEKLRALSEEEDGPDVFARFKELQEAWKQSGRVPFKYAEELRETYHALSDIIYDKRSIYFELKDLDRKKNLEKKVSLCEKIEQLEAVEDIVSLKKQFYDLRDEYRHTGPVPLEDKQTVSERFTKACDAILEKIRQEDTAYKEQQENNLKLKQQILEKLREITASDITDPVAWKQASEQVLGLQNSWKSIGQVPRSRLEQIGKEFWKLFKDFFKRKHQFFRELDKKRATNLDIKNELCARAEALKDSTDWENTAAELKKIQQEWFQTGPVPGKHVKKLNERFKAACNHFFERRRNRRQEREEEDRKSYEEKQLIVQEIEGLIKKENPTPEDILPYTDKWEELGKIPSGDQGKLLERYILLLSSFFEKFQQTEYREAARELHDRLKSRIFEADPASSYYIEKHERSLIKKADKLEESVTLLKNNIEFLAHSSGADKLRSEYEQKIKQSEEELARIRAEIKNIRRSR